jgi:hypothetical protein
MSAIQPAADRIGAKFIFLGVLFAICWIATLLLTIGPGHEAFGALAMAGSFGAAVAPWCAGAAITAISGRSGRPVALVVCLLAVAALWIAPRL